MHDESVRTWKFQRVGLVLEFRNSSIAPAPLSLLEDLWLRCTMAPARGDASARGARELCPDDSPSLTRVCDGSAGALAPLLDWHEWLALAAALNLRRLWRGWPGFFRPGADCGGLLGARCGADDAGRSRRVRGGAGSCLCLQCQGRLLRTSADAVAVALEAWRRRRGERKLAQAVHARTHTT